MITVQITDAQRERAKIEAEPLARKYANNRKSILRGKGVYYGKLGEIIVCDTMGWRSLNTYNFDAEATKRDGTRLRIEVKTKKRGVPPRGKYNGSIAVHNTTQDCDYYIFCSTLDDQVGYILGIIKPVDFYAEAIFKKEGEPDLEGPPGWFYRDDCHNLWYNKMHQIGPEPLR